MKFSIIVLPAAVVLAAALTVASSDGYQEGNGRVIAKREVLENPPHRVARLSLSMSKLPIILSSDKNHCKIYSKVNRTYENTVCSAIDKNDHLVREQFECKLVYFVRNSMVDKKVSEHNCDTSEETSKYYLPKYDEPCYPMWKRSHTIEYGSDYMGIFDTLKECSDGRQLYFEEILSETISSKFHLTPEWKCESSEDVDLKKEVDDLNAPAYIDTFWSPAPCYKKSWESRIIYAEKVALATLTYCTDIQPPIYKTVKSCRGYQKCKWIEKNDNTTKENYKLIMQQNRNTDPIGLFCIGKGTNWMNCSTDVLYDRKINTVCGKNESQNLIKLRVAILDDCLETSEKFYSKVSSCKHFATCKVLSIAELVEMGLQEMYEDKNNVYANCDAKKKGCTENEGNINAICPVVQVR